MASTLALTCSSWAISMKLGALAALFPCFSLLWLISHCLLACLPAAQKQNSGRAESEFRRPVSSQIGQIGIVVSLQKNNILLFRLPTLLTRCSSPLHRGSAQAICNECLVTQTTRRGC